MKKAFTLLEVITVILILGILATMAVPMFIKSIETAKNKEAVAALRLIRTAERLYYLEYENYIAASTTEEINTKLDLAIESENWKFDVSVSGSNFQACADRLLTSRPRTICIDLSGNITCNPTTSDFCKQL